MSRVETWHRRQAIVLASQLPENRADAVSVLGALSELLDTFLAEPEPTQKPAPVGVLIGGNERT